MNLIKAILAWVMIGAVLGVGLYLAVIPNGSPWLLILSVIGFIVAVGKIGCSTH